MKINKKKTQLLVISPPNGCTTTRSFSVDPDHRYDSVEIMRLVGYTFDTVPDAGAHVAAVEQQYRTKKWLLYHLRDKTYSDSTAAMSVP